MRKLILAVAILGLAACQPGGGDYNTNTNASVNTISANGSDCGLTSNTIKDEQALLVAETAYNIPAQAYVSLGSKLPTATRTKVRGYLIQAYDYLKLARAAYNAGDNCNLQKYADLAKNLGDKANTVLHQ
jgi:hypothetical protein